MILGSHLILSTYGFWLPNDPRGSWSDEVWAPRLRPFGPATKVTTHRSVAGRPHDRRQRLAAKRALLRPPVVFTGLQARAVARGIADYVARSEATVWACAVMPDHVHLVLARHRHFVEVMANHIKGDATRRLVAEGIHPFQGQVGEKGRVPKCFGEGQWKVFLDTEADILRTIKYVEDNPLKAGLNPQRWGFVVPYPERYKRPDGPRPLRGHG